MQSIAYIELVILFAWNSSKWRWNLNKNNQKEEKKEEKEKK